MGDVGRIPRPTVVAADSFEHRKVLAVIAANSVEVILRSNHSLGRDVIEVRARYTSLPTIFMLWNQNETPRF